MRRIERLINLIAALLDSPTPMTAEEIRTRIAGYDQPTDEAFRRAFERDKADLKSIGIPIETQDVGALEAPGYTIPKKKYYLPQLDLEPDEVAALSVAAEAVLGGGDEAEMGLLKVTVGTGGPDRAAPRVSWGAEVAAEQPLLEPLYSALAERSIVSFLYRPADRDQADRREVEPYALVLSGGKWYLVGNDRSRGELRRFRLSRIEGSIETRPGRYEIPGSFDAQREIARHPWEVGDEPTDAVVRFGTEARWWAEQNLTESTATEASDGALDVRLRVANLDALVSWVIERGEGVEIVAPPEARERLVEHLAPFLRPTEVMTDEARE